MSTSPEGSFSKYYIFPIVETKIGYAEFVRFYFTKPVTNEVSNSFKYLSRKSLAEIGNSTTKRCSYEEKQNF